MYYASLGIFLAIRNVVYFLNNIIIKIVDCLLYVRFLVYLPCAFVLGSEECTKKKGRCSTFILWYLILECLMLRSVLSNRPLYS